MRCRQLRLHGDRLAEKPLGALEVLVLELLLRPGKLRTGPQEAVFSISLDGGAGRENDNNGAESEDPVHIRLAPLYTMTSGRRGTPGSYRFSTRR
jgi:hypothetical protein